MRADPIVLSPYPRRGRRSTGERLREAVLALAGGYGEVLLHSETAWASITFAGTRHRLRMAFEGAEAVAGGEELVAALPEHEFEAQPMRRGAGSRALWCRSRAWWWTASCCCSRMLRSQTRSG